MNKNFKLQSAMEYLMTYGWAILVIAIVLVALFALGVFNGSSFLSTSCIASSGYICSQPTATPTGASNVLVTLNFGQNTGATAYNTIIALAPQSSAQNPAGYPSTISANTAIGTLSAGAIQSVNFQVPSSEFTSGNAIGSQFSGYVWLNYSTTQTGASSSAVKTATIIVKVT